MLKEAGVYTVVETRGSFHFSSSFSPLIFDCSSFCLPSLYRIIDISVAHVFGREKLQKVRGDCCPGVGSNDFFSLRLSPTPFLKFSPLALSLVSLSPARLAGCSCLLKKSSLWAWSTPPGSRRCLRPGARHPGPFCS